MSNDAVLTDMRGLSYEQTVARLDRIFAEARTFAAARAEREQMAREARRDLLVARGQARAARGRLYDTIQLGRLP